MSMLSTVSTARVRLGQSMLDNIVFFNSRLFSDVNGKKAEKKLCLFSYVNVINSVKRKKKKKNSCLCSEIKGKTSSTTRVRLGQSMLDNIFFQFISFF